MTGATDIVKNASVVARTTAGPLVEIRFRGKHEDGCGSELIDYVRQTVRDLQPAGVILNLSDFKYRWGNDIGALLSPLFDERRRRFRPFCIVASGRTAESLKTLFEPTHIPDFMDAKYFRDFDDALAWLKAVNDARE